MKRLKDKSDVSEERHATLPKTHTSSKRKTKLHSSRPRKNGYSQQSIKEPEGREFVVDFGASMHMVSKKGLNSAELETMRKGHQGVLRRWWRPTARCKPEQKSRYMSKNWTYSWQLCFLKKHPQFFHSGSSARIMGILTTGPAVKNHISPKMARELIATYQTICHSSSLVYRRVKQIHRKSSTRMKWKYERGVTGKPAA